MIDYGYLGFALVCISATGVFGGWFTRRTDGKNLSGIYNLIFSASALVAWGILYIFDFSFDAKVLLYSLGFGVCYALTSFGLINALKLGSVSITNLLMQSSLISTSIWGLIFWRDQSPFTPLVVVGLIGVVVSLYLCLGVGKDKSGKKFNGKWLFFALMMFIGNSGCCIIQKQQQIDFPNAHGTLFMFGAMVLSLGVSALLLIKSPKVDGKGKLLKRSWFCPVLAGAGNMLSNFFVILLASGSLSPSLVYPVLSVGGLAITTLASVLFFKEKLSVWQWIGFIIGGFATACLSV